MGIGEPDNRPQTEIGLALSSAISSAIKLSVAQEREACAKLADEFDCDGRELDLVALAADIAASIRKRGEQ